MAEESARKQPTAASPASRRNAWIAAIVLVFAAVVARYFDLVIADTFFYDRAAGDWIGANTWWAVDVIHTGGGWLVRLVGLAALAIAAFGSRIPRLEPLRRRAVFVALAIIACTSVVSGLKQVTNVDCPRDLAHFGGNRPYVGLFADRPDELPRGRCYPGSHASSGFALMSFYFVFLGRRPRHAKAALAAAALIGAVFSIGQQARGAHFLSHDLASAAVSWILLLVLDRWLLESAGADRTRLISEGADVQGRNDGPSGESGIVRRQGPNPAIAGRRGTRIRRVFRRVLRARLPLCAATPEWRPRSDPGSRFVRPGQGDAEPRGFSR